jgi:enamine deaminase RidA (YjgF/YER057c/UK114 family)
MSEIERFGSSSRWSDLVVYRGVAHWVEVADDMSLDVRGQVAQVLNQIDATLASFGGKRTDLLQVLIYITDLRNAQILNELWDAWVPAGHPPVRAMVQAGLAGEYRVEMVITAAAPDSSAREG